MLETGLVSVSFRNLSVEEVITAAQEAGLSGIEWGGDIHVPPGDVQLARRVRKLTEESGLQIFAYGSYYRPGEHTIEVFYPVLETAKALGAPSIRVWAGAKWSWRADEAYVQKVIEDTRKICDLAAAEKIKICYEYHGWTLTDNRISACEAQRGVGKENMYLYWQPNYCLTHEENLLAVKMVLPYLNDVHVFFWDCLGKRYPLEEGKTLWKEYLKVIRSDGKNHRLMLEFAKDDSVEQMTKDAAVLKELVKETQESELYNFQVTQ